MSADVSGLPVACPAWCTEADCRGEHRGGMDYVPATAALPDPSSYGGGWWFPGVGVGLAWDTLDFLQPAVVIHVGGEGVDTQVDLHLHEAKRLLDNLATAIAVLELHPHARPRAAW